MRVQAQQLRRFVSFPAMLGALLLALAVLSVRSRFDDPDLWWNLKLGQVIWTTHSIPVTDLFSYTTNHHAYIPHEWLAQVIIYGAYGWGGYRGLMVLLCLMTGALLLAGYILCTLYAGNAKAGFLGALTIWLFATIGLSIRAQMIGYLLFIFEMIFMQLGRTKNPRWFFCLPVLFAIWINCHASFILGLMVALVIWSCSFCRFQAGSLRSPSWDPRTQRLLGLSLTLSGAAIFLNPVGWKQIDYPIQTMFNMPLNLGNVAEFAPLQMTSDRGIAMILVLLLSALLVAMHRSEIFLDEAVLLAIGTWMAVSHVRMLFVFGILAAPIVARQVAQYCESGTPQSDRPGLNAALIGAALAAAYLAFPSSQSLQAQVEEMSPVRAVAFIKANRLSGPMLNAHAFGGYLIWAAPEHPVFVDGRTDVFEWSGVLREFGQWATLQADPNILLNRYGVNFCLLNKDSPMVRVLPLLPQWKVIYSDRNAVIVARIPVRSTGEVSQAK